MKWKNPFSYTKEEKALSDAHIRRNKSVRHLLTPQQKEMHTFLFASEESEAGYYCSRKVGKTGSLLLMCYEFAWKFPGTLTRFVLADQTQATQIIEPMINTFINKLIPVEMRPRYLKTERLLRFSNGSVVKLNGANPDAIDRCVGPSCNLFIFDEIAIWSGDVKYALLDVFFPQGTLTKAKKIYSCTPPPFVDSYYIQHIHPKLLSKNVLVTLTIYENPLLDEKQIEKIKEEMGGEDSPEFQRQYLCKLIPSNSTRVVPEFDEGLHTYEIRDKFIDFGLQILDQKYQYFLVADTATADNTAILVGYLDHNNQDLVIEEEFVKNNINLTEIANEFKFLEEKYTEFYYDPDNGVKRIIDAFSLERKELREIHHIQHLYPIKGKVEDNISHLRSAFENNKIKVSNKCVRLIWELKNCVWKQDQKVNKQIDRNEEQKHGDAIMALTYMLRAVNWRFRPDNKGYNISLTNFNPEKNKLEDMRKRTPLIWNSVKTRKSA